jgi:hypothetical protein
MEGELNSLSLMLQKQVLELVALIGLRIFLKEHVIRKLGVLIPMEVASRLYIINGTRRLTSS